MKWQGLFVLLFSFIFTSCENDQRENSGQTVDTVIIEKDVSAENKNDAAPPSEETTGDEKGQWSGSPDPGTDPPNTRNKVTVNDQAFMKNAFVIGEINRTNLKRHFDDVQIVKTQTRQNRHVPSRTDTILTLNAAHSIFVIVKTGGKEMLQKAEVNTDEVQLYRGIEYGMSLSEFQEEFPQLPSNLSRNVTVNVEGEPSSANWQFKFSNGFLKNLVFSGYVD